MGRQVDKERFFHEKIGFSSPASPAPSAPLLPPFPLLPLLISTLNLKNLPLKVDAHELFRLNLGKVYV